MKYCWFGLALGGILLLLNACNLEKEIEIELPEYEEQLVLECYLEPGLPYRLSLTKSNAFFDALPSGQNVLAYLQGILVGGAQISIRHQGNTIRLINTLNVDFQNQRFFNYVAQEIVPLDTSGIFELDVVTADGRTIKAQTQIPQKVFIDSVAIDFKAGDTLSARTLTYFTDIPGKANYYRRVLHRNRLNTTPEQDFSVDDRFVKDVFVFGSGYDFKEGDTLIHTIYHIDEPYYRFLESVRGAVSGNSNPFSQPSTILSNLSGNAGAVGIFTGLRYDRVYSIVKRK